MRQSVDGWLTVVDARGRFTAAVGLVFAFVVSLIEIGGAGIVAVSIQLATHDSATPVRMPVLGDVGGLLPGSDRSSDLKWMALIGSVFFVLRGLAVVAQQYLTFRSSYGLAVRLTDRVMAEFLSRDYEWHLSQNSAELSSVSIAICQYFAAKVFTPLQLAGSQALTVLSLGVVALAVEPVGAIGAMLAIVVVVALLLWGTRRRLLPLSQVEVEEVAVGQQLTIEAFQAIREVKVLDLAATMRERVWESRRRWAHALRRSSTIIAAPRTVIETVAFAALITLVAYRGQGDSEGALAGIGVLGYAVIRILPSANNMVTHINTVRSGQASMQRLVDILRPEHRDSAHAARASQPASLPLEAVDVHFGYPTTHHQVLAGINIRVEAGASIGFVGATGCGKSTLLDVFAGLLEPTSGQVLLDGVPLADCRQSWWSQIGIVPQTITLLDASLAENIALGVPASAIDRTALDRAVRLAQLEGVVADMPAGLESAVGERGIRLSGGQRQRVAIARALYRDPPIIFLDEGTSALDTHTERAVIDALRADRPERTLLMVAHRISTLKDCDEILLLEKGRVVSRGTHRHLLKTDARFRRLAAADAT